MKPIWNREEKISRVIMECYRELFKKAEPPADFDKLVKTGEAKKENFFMNYYLDDDIQERIIEEICRKHKLAGGKWNKSRAQFSWVVPHRE